MRLTKINKKNFNVMGNFAIAKRKKSMKIQRKNIAADSIPTMGARFLAGFIKKVSFGIIY